MKILIVIPAYNEEKSIERVVDNLIENYSQYDYIVVNDGSKDGTARVCRDRGYRFIDLPINLGLTGAFQTGVKYAAVKGYDRVLQFDGDGQHRAEYIQDLMDEMDKGYDIVIGSRFVNEKKPKTLRMAGSRLIAAAIRITTGQKIKDPTSGMRLFNRVMIEQFAVGLNHSPEPDTISYLLKCGARISEVQANMDERQEGQSYLSFAKSIGYMARVVTSIILIQNFRKKEPIARKDER
ncbi:glycosyltransferase family 2 protein [Murimonas intestini]|uniref:glycosyltransferase family 2 protein n=1 Tax=Murimonas intestini TaxID=1337051 RepID=UPI0011DDA8F9|nr:glycosyltransferase family 2 protein [Murimonas intestini]